jgi:hypothetical protein
VFFTVNENTLTQIALLKMFSVRIECNTFIYQKDIQ